MKSVRALRLWVELSTRAIRKLRVWGKSLLIHERGSNTIFPHLINDSEQRNEGADGAENPGGLTDADFDSNWDEAIETFDGMEIPEELLRGIYSYGFEKPSAIQQRAIKPTMLGRDLIAQAQSGTVSRTTDYLVFIVQKLGMKIGTKHHLSSLNRVTLNVSENFQTQKQTFRLHLLILSS